MKIVMSVLALLVLLTGTAVTAIADTEQTIKGQVISIDSAGKTLVIDTSEGQKTVVLQDTTRGLEGVKPGMSVEMTCIDLGGKACAKDIRIISASGTAAPAKIMEGEIVSIDSEGKTVVIKTPAGEKTTISVKDQPTVEKVTVREGIPPEESIAVERIYSTELKPGQKVQVVCMDSGGQFCAKNISVIPLDKAGMPVPGTQLVGKVVSIDPANKAVVIATPTGNRPLYYQKSTSGTPMGELKVGEDVRAYCLDVGGKSCIRNIEAAP